MAWKNFSVSDKFIWAAFMAGKNDLDFTKNLILDSKSFESSEEENTIANGIQGWFFFLSTNTVETVDVKYSFADMSV